MIMIMTRDELRKAIEEQKNWIKKCGGTKLGYAVQNRQRCRNQEESDKLYQDNVDHLKNLEDRLKEANAAAANVKVEDFATNAANGYYDTRGDEFAVDFDQFLRDNGVPESYLPKVRQKAWEDGHGYGLYNVVQVAEGLAWIFN